MNGRHMFSIAELESAQYLGEGANRYCVVSPFDPKICLKIDLPKERRQIKNWRQRLQRFLSTQFYRFNENYIEWSAYQRLQAHIDQNELNRFIAACLKLEVIEDQLILSCELIRDEHGEISLSLHHYLKHKMPLNIDGVSQSIDQLTDWLIQYNIPLFDLNSGNLVVQHHHEGIRLKCIDVKSTFKSKEIIPLSYWSRVLMHKKIRRRAERLKQLIRKTM